MGRIFLCVYCNGPLNSQVCKRHQVSKLYQYSLSYYVHFDKYPAWNIYFFKNNAIELETVYNCQKQYWFFFLMCFYFEHSVFLYDTNKFSFSKSVILTFSWLKNDHLQALFLWIISNFIVKTKSKHSRICLNFSNYILSNN